MCQFSRRLRRTFIRAPNREVFSSVDSADFHHLMWFWRNWPSKLGMTLHTVFDISTSWNKLTKNKMFLDWLQSDWQTIINFLIFSSVHISPKSRTKLTRKLLSFWMRRATWRGTPRATPFWRLVLSLPLWFLCPAARPWPSLSSIFQRFSPFATYA